MQIENKERTWHPSEAAAAAAAAAASACIFNDCADLERERVLDAVDEDVANAEEVRGECLVVELLVVQLRPRVSTVLFETDRS